MPPPELAANALVSLDEARAFLQKDESENQQDEVLVELINGASDQIIDHTGHEFAPKGAAEEPREFVFAGGRFLDLFPYDIRSVSAVVLGSDLEPAQQVALSAGEWKLRPKPAKHGAYQKLKLPPAKFTSTMLCLDEIEVTVTGLWGFPAVPEMVKHWCKVTVAIWLRKDVSAFSRTLAIDEDRLEVPDGLPSSVVRGLCDFTRKPAVIPR